MLYKDCGYDIASLIRISSARDQVRTKGGTPYIWEEPEIPPAILPRTALRAVLDASAIPGVCVTRQIGHGVALSL